MDEWVVGVKVALGGWRWEGVAPSGQGTLQAGSVVAVGLAFGAALTPQPGFLSTPWSEQIDLISPS